MPCWYFNKEQLKDTPSIRDGISYETECRYRTEGARFIIDTGAKMDLGYNTIATGVVYFHRFYMFHSFKTYPRYVTACSCLFLAGKVEETPKKCKDIIKTAKTLLPQQKFATFGEDPKEEVMTLERMLLQTIKFDLQVEHPYKYLLRYAKCLKGEKGKLQNMIQMAWTFVNDSLCTTLCLQWEPEIIAVALIYLAGRLSKFEVVDWVGREPKHVKWWNLFVEDITMDILEDICLQALDLYPQANNQRVLNSQNPNPLNESTQEAISTTPPPPVPPLVTSAASQTPSVTSSSIPTIEENNTVSIDGQTPVEITDQSRQQVEPPPVQFSSYPINFSNNLIYPTVYPPLDMSVPPPNVPPIGNMIPPHLGTSNSMSHILPPSPVRPPPFPPYHYPANLSYYPRMPGPPFANQRSYYPPQL